MSLAFVPFLPADNQLDCGVLDPASIKAAELNYDALCSFSSSPSSSSPSFLAFLRSYLRYRARGWELSVKELKPSPTLARVDAALASLLEREAASFLSLDDLFDIAAVYGAANPEFAKALISKVLASSSRPLNRLIANAATSLSATIPSALLDLANKLENTEKGETTKSLLTKDIHDVCRFIVDSCYAVASLLALSPHACFAALSPFAEELPSSAQLLHSADAASGAGSAFKKSPTGTTAPGALNASTGPGPGAGSSSSSFAGLRLLDSLNRSSSSASSSDAADSAAELPPIALVRALIGTIELVIPVAAAIVAKAAGSSGGKGADKNSEESDSEDDDESDDNNSASSVVAECKRLLSVASSSGMSAVFSLLSTCYFSVIEGNAVDRRAPLPPAPAAASSSDGARKSKKSSKDKAEKTTLRPASAASALPPAELLRSQRGDPLHAASQLMSVISGLVAFEPPDLFREQLQQGSGSGYGGDMPTIVASTIAAVRTAARGNGPSSSANGPSGPGQIITSFSFGSADGSEAAGSSSNNNKKRSLFIRSFVKATNLESRLRRVFSCRVRPPLAGGVAAQPIPVAGEANSNQVAYCLSLVRSCSIEASPLGKLPHSSSNNSRHGISSSADAAAAGSLAEDEGEEVSEGAISAVSAVVPGVPRSEVERALRLAKGDVDAAVDRLLSFVPASSSVALADAKKDQGDDAENFPALGRAVSSASSASAASWKSRVSGATRRAFDEGSNNKSESKAKTLAILAAQEDEEERKREAAVKAAARYGLVPDASGNGRFVYLPAQEEEAGGTVPSTVVAVDAVKNAKFEYEDERDDAYDEQESFLKGLDSGGGAMRTELVSATASNARKGKGKDGDHDDNGAEGDNDDTEGGRSSKLWRPSASNTAPAGRSFASRRVVASTSIAGSSSHRAGAAQPPVSSASSASSSLQAAFAAAANAAVAAAAKKPTPASGALNASAADFVPNVGAVPALPPPPPGFIYHPDGSGALIFAGGSPFVSASASVAPSRDPKELQRRQQQQQPQHQSLQAQGAKGSKAFGNPSPRATAATLRGEAEARDLLLFGGGDGTGIGEAPVAIAAGGKRRLEAPVETEKAKGKEKEPKAAAGGAGGGAGASGKPREAVEGHGPRARGGLTEREAAIRRENKGKDHRAAADKKMSKGMF